MLESAAKALNIPLKDYCIQINEHNLNVGLNSFFKFLMKLGGTRRVLKSTPQMAKSYTNTLEYEITSNNEGEHVAKIITPGLFCEWNMYMVAGGISRIVNECGTSIRSLVLTQSSTIMKEGEEWNVVDVNLKYS